jgi:hypothetical protein
MMMKDLLDFDYDADDDVDEVRSSHGEDDVGEIGVVVAALQDLGHFRSMWAWDPNHHHLHKWKTYLCYTN